MYSALENGHLLVCKWLFVGAAEDIRTPDNLGYTPMYSAIKNGHLSVCKWLFDVGAAEDIRTPDRFGRTPMYSAIENGHLSVCKWLLLNGALNNNGGNKIDLSAITTLVDNSKLENIEPFK